MIRAFGSAVKSMCGCFGRSDSLAASLDEDYGTGPFSAQPSRFGNSSKKLRQALLPRNRNDEELSRRSGYVNEDNADIRSICREDLTFKFERACGDPNGPEARELREAEIWVVKVRKPAATRSTTAATLPRLPKQQTVAGRKKSASVGSSLDAASVGHRLMRDSEAMSRASEMAENAFSAVSPSTAQSVTLKNHSSFQDRCRTGRGAVRGFQGQFARERIITSCIEE